MQTKFTNIQLSTNSQAITRPDPHIHIYLFIHIHVRVYLCAAVGVFFTAVGNDEKVIIAI